MLDMHIAIEANSFSFSHPKVLESVYLSVVQTLPQVLANNPRAAVNALCK